MVGLPVLSIILNAIVRTMHMSLRESEFLSW